MEAICMERIAIINTNKLLEVRNASLDDSRFEFACLERVYMENDCDTDGMKINGILVKDLLKEYERTINK
jgi:hypothetical protein